MGEPISAGVLVGLQALALGGQTYQAREQSQAGRRQAKDQAATQDRIFGDIQKQQEGEANAAQQARERAIARQRQLAFTGGGRAGTILTGPLGLVGQPQSTGQTLLGA